MEKQNQKKYNNGVKMNLYNIIKKDNTDEVISKIIRHCDHLKELPEYIAPMAEALNQKPIDLAVKIYRITAKRQLPCRDKYDFVCQVYNTAKEFEELYNKQKGEMNGRNKRM